MRWKKKSERKEECVLKVLGALCLLGSNLFHVGLVVSNLWLWFNALKGLSPGNESLNQPFSPPQSKKKTFNPIRKMNTKELKVKQEDNENSVKNIISKMKT